MMDTKCTSSNINNNNSYSNNPSMAARLTSQQPNSSTSLHSNNISNSNKCSNNRATTNPTLLPQGLKMGTKGSRVLPHQCFLLTNNSSSCMGDRATTCTTSRMWMATKSLLQPFNRRRTTHITRSFWLAGLAPDFTENLFFLPYSYHHHYVFANS